MNLTRCNQGHFYDADKYNTCPHCEKTAAPQQKTVPSESAMPVPKQQPIPQPAQQPPQQPVSSLKKEVDDVQKTVAMFGVKNGDKQPVAGWLVCVDGPHFGEDFRIVMGRNFVGRAANMDIILSKDQSVSRERHAIIVYEPKGNMFIIQAGDSKELFYLNDSVVLSPTEMHAYDTLKIGASSLLFVPFCSENFKWDSTDNNA